MPDKRVISTDADVKPGFSERWLAEAVRLESFPESLQQRAETSARNHTGDAESRVLRWAAVLAAHTGLLQAKQSWRQRASAVLIVMLVLAAGGGLSAALGVMGRGDTPVNVLWALGALLGVNLLMLALWLLSLLMAPGTMSAGRLWFWLSARFYGRDAVFLAQSFSALSQRAGATRWWLAAISHGMWCAALAGALAGLLIALSLRSYAFVWETTILPASVFTSLVQSLALLPSLVGFPMPDEATIGAAGMAGNEVLAQSDGQRRAWAGWLCGAVLVYGLVPRLLLLLLSVWQMVHRLSRVRLPLHSAEWSALSERLTPPSQLMGVTDPASDMAEPESKRDRQLLMPGQAVPVVVGFELSEQIEWPPAFVTSLWYDPLVERVDTRQQRTSVLQQLDQASPRALLLVCDSAQTVDRGSLAWLGEASGRVLHVAVWLAGEEAAPRRSLWRQQLQTLGLMSDVVFDSEADVRQWLEAHQ